MVNATVYVAEVAGLTCDGVATDVNVLIGSADAADTTSKHAVVAVIVNRRRRLSMNPLEQDGGVEAKECEGNRADTDGRKVAVVRLERLRKLGPRPSTSRSDRGPE